MNKKEKAWSGGVDESAERTEGNMKCTFRTGQIKFNLICPPFVLIQ